MYPLGTVTGSVLFFLSLLLKNGLVFAVLQGDPSVMLSSGSLWSRGSRRLCQAQGRRYVLPKVWLCRGG